MTDEKIKIKYPVLPGARVRSRRTARGAARETKLERVKIIVRSFVIRFELKRGTWQRSPQKFGSLTGRKAVKPKSRMSM